MSVELDLGPPRDQGPRPTCMSFAVSEIHRASIGCNELISPESLHRSACASAKKSIAQGLTIEEASQALLSHGQTVEDDWPYGSSDPLKVNCKYYKNIVTREDDIYLCVQGYLEIGNPVALIIDIDLPFFMCRNAAPLDLSDGVQIEGRHAVVICGFRSPAGSLEYLIKNSWGEGWGLNGYAWLTSRYVAARDPALIRI